ncbi:hypothetical protein PAXINDRAFT_15833 [Paxillus involutus ATCC 200175]|uniref:Uncharacterized protein n=1 Tax=Paxillus involutus ATCC 200175 TaxID=664439 RepID=A0A0C9TKU7_PAXIN|nr:hypothetical protein PAXINDRAFT_15833 [Paxillus involutus ATCC 200175]
MSNQCPSHLTTIPPRRPNASKSRTPRKPRLTLNMAYPAACTCLHDARNAFVKFKQRLSGLKVHTYREKHRNTFVTPEKRPSRLKSHPTITLTVGLLTAARTFRGPWDHEDDRMTRRRHYNTTGRGDHWHKTMENQTRPLKSGNSWLGVPPTALTLRTANRTKGPRDKVSPAARCPHPPGPPRTLAGSSAAARSCSLTPTSLPFAVLKYEDDTMRCGETNEGIAI